MKRTGSVSINFYLIIEKLIIDSAAYLIDGNTFGENHIPNINPIRDLLNIKVLADTLLLSNDTIRREYQYNKR